MSAMDRHFMQMAIDTARMGQGQTSPNPMVGAVVVHQGMVVGQGAHLRAGTPHAERHALTMAGEQARGATIYVTLEPCNHYGRTPPCTEAIIEAGIRRVVVGGPDRDPRTAQLGIARLREAGIEVEIGVMQEEAEHLNRAFFHRVETGRPLLVYKTAMTLSGHVAANSGQSAFVTGEAARADVQRLRQAHAGIAVGIGTVLADNPRLTVRIGAVENGDEAGLRQPVRLVFDSRLRIPLDARLLAEPGDTWVVTSQEAVADQAGKVQALEDKKGVSVIAIGQDEAGHIDLKQALREIAARGLNSILLEGGPTVAGAMLERKLIDEVCVYLAPKLLLNGLPAILGPATTHMREAFDLTNVLWEKIGDDMKVTGRVASAGKVETGPASPKRISGGVNKEG